MPKFRVVTLVPVSAQIEHFRLRGGLIPEAMQSNEEVRAAQEFRREQKRLRSNPTGPETARETLARIEHAAKRRESEVG